MDDVDALRAALRQHRLSKGMSYEQLAADLAEVLGVERKLSLYTLRTFIEGFTQPIETTRYTIAEYLREKDAR